MRRIALVTFLVFCTFFATRAAWAYTPPANDGPITDPAHYLTPEQKAQLDAKLRAYRDRTTNEITYFIAASLEGENREDVAYATFHTGVSDKPAKTTAFSFSSRRASVRSRSRSAKGSKAISPTSNPTTSSRRR